MDDEKALITIARVTNGYEMVFSNGKHRGFHTNISEIPETAKFVFHTKKGVLSAIEGLLDAGLDIENITCTLLDG